MCNEKSHTGLTQPEHFTRHAMSVEQVRALGSSGVRELAPWAGVIDACEALALADRGVDEECVKQLKSFVTEHIPEVSLAS